MSINQITNLRQESLQYYQRGQLIEARSTLKKILKKIPADFESLHFMGVIYIQAREYEKGIEYLDRALKINPNSLRVAINLGSAYLEINSHIKAITYFTKALSIDSNNVDVYCSLGHAFAFVQKTDEAIECFSKAIAIDPNSVKASIGLGVLYADSKDYQKAIEAYRAALEVNPDCSDAYNNLGYAYTALGKFVDAKESFTKAIDKNPKLIDSHIGLARSLTSLNEVELAIKAYKTTFSYRQDPEALFELGQLLQRTKRYQEAQHYYKQAINHNPEYVEAFIGLGISYAGENQHELAAETFVNIIAINPNNYDAYNNLGNAKFELKQYSDAALSYETAISINPNLIEGHIGLGNALTQLEKYEGAVKAYEKILDINEESPEGYHGLGIIMVEFEKYDQAIAYYKKALEKNPSYTKAICNHAIVLEKLKQFDEALKLYDQALSIESDFADARWNRTLLYLLRGEYEAGWSEYEFRWSLKETIPLPIAPYPIPEWLGKEPIVNKKLLIQVEQGFGDMIQMSRYIQLLTTQNTECWLQCPSPIVSLFRTSFPQAHVFEDTLFPDDMDFRISIMSLPLAMQSFNESLIPSTVPYLKVDPVNVERWRLEFLPKQKPLVGLVWRGNPKHSNDKNRSASIDHFVTLIDSSPELQFITLQKNMTAYELGVITPYNNVTILDDQLLDFEDTASVIQLLDILITIDSAPAHLAGALAIPTWILLPYHGEWRWLLNRQDSPWYPTARLFRQERARDWSSVIRNIGMSLKSLGSK